MPKACPSNRSSLPPRITVAEHRALASGMDLASAAAILHQLSRPEAVPELPATLHSCGTNWSAPWPGRADGWTTRIPRSRDTHRGISEG
jgi:hypothetical protein